MKSYNVLRFIPVALAAPPVVDPFLEVCGVSVTLSMVTNTLLLPPQTISLCENSNCAIPPITAGEGLPPASTQHYEVPNTQLPHETVSQAPGGSNAAGGPAGGSAGGPPGGPAATQPGGSPPSAQPPASNAPEGSSSVANPAGGSNGNSPAATTSSSGKPPAVSTSSASRSFGAQWDELLVMGVIGCVILASLGLGL
ncbi:hypothetical protein CNYM01_12798 [Colletotrichum nymphaeae SA-01]|uniref:Uncharacterized protein n=1 Tax=Colletotrichum nymphaeae SA-01 TaxID=1460502 RepID=A0A135UFL2_9PEZI|nr:hypothetical protein CNYM01_12798 [Colletotrichum nymphaeae SA-01]